MAHLQSADAPGILHSRHQKVATIARDADSTPGQRRVADNIPTRRTDAVSRSWLIIHHDSRQLNDLDLTEACRRCSKCDDPAGRSYQDDRGFALVTLRCGCHYHLHCFDIIFSLSLPLITCHNITASFFYLRYNEEFHHVMIDIRSYRCSGLPWEKAIQSETPLHSMEDNHECIICLEEISPMNMNTHSVATDCGHYFHAACLAPYFVQLERGAFSSVPERPKCPTCRKTVLRVWTTSNWCHSNNWGRKYWPSEYADWEGLREIQFNPYSPVMMPELQRP
ncbi:hypothetical protein F5Y13DRAFT_102570 [Hypoxylon sp. FL1857]|nr:hypothetical protein F5Y13DRAFT_102570 [Hypoxylon sp. FL1857]